MLKVCNKFKREMYLAKYIPLHNEIKTIMLIFRSEEGIFSLDTYFATNKKSELMRIFSSGEDEYEERGQLSKLEYALKLLSTFVEKLTAKGYVMIDKNPEDYSRKALIRKISNSTNPIKGVFLPPYISKPYYKCSSNIKALGLNSIRRPIYNGFRCQFAYKNKKVITPFKWESKFLCTFCEKLNEIGLFENNKYVIDGEFVSESDNGNEETIIKNGDYTNDVKFIIYDIQDANKTFKLRYLDMMKIKAFLEHNNIDFISVSEFFTGSESVNVSLVKMHQIGYYGFVLLKNDGMYGSSDERNMIVFPFIKKMYRIHDKEIHKKGSRYYINLITESGKVFTVDVLGCKIRISLLKQIISNNDACYVLFNKYTNEDIPYDGVFSNFLNNYDEDKYIDFCPKKSYEEKTDEFIRKNRL